MRGSTRGPWRVVIHSHSPQSLRTSVVGPRSTPPSTYHVAIGGSCSPKVRWWRGVDRQTIVEYSDGDVEDVTREVALKGIKRYDLEETI